MKKWNEPMWCCKQLEQLEEKIKDYKLSLSETENEDVRRQLKIVIEDLEEILYN